MSEPRGFRLPGAGIELQVYDYGNEGAPNVVLVHGMQDLALGLRPLAEPLSEHYRVIAYDLRGHGDSDKPGIYALPHFIADLHAVVAQLELDRPHLVGHSLGGHIVTQYAATFPEIPQKIVNCEGIGAPFRYDQIPQDARQLRVRNGISSLLRPGGHKRPMGGLEDAWHLFCRFHPRMDPEHARFLVEIGTTEHPHGGLQWKWDPHVETIGLSMAPALLEERWGWIECPVLIATAEHGADFYRGRGGIDWETPVANDEVERRIGLFRGAEHVVIPDAGHMVHYDNSAALLPEIQRFLG